MPHALTDRQRDYLNFIKHYIAQNEISPRLEEVAGYFDVKLPTAHKTLAALQRKGFLFFDRTSASGFFIRLIEKAGAQEIVMQVPLMGKINRLGEVYDFPDMLGEFPAVIDGSRPEDIFALVLTADIPHVNMEANDFIILDKGKKPQPGDLCLGVFKEHYILIRITKRTFDDRYLSYDAAQDYPFPAALGDPDRNQRLHYEAIADTDEPWEVFSEKIDEAGLPYAPLPGNLAFGTALRLVRALAF